jgi:hypothetical protein
VTQQGLIAFQQKLYAKEKATGTVQLFRARQEVAQLQSQLSSSPFTRLLGPSFAEEESSVGNCRTGQAAAVQQLRHHSSCCHQPVVSCCSASKRISTPENPALYSVPAVSTASAATTAAAAAVMSSRHVALQQQLLQHRLQQKRHQSLQKHQRYSLAEPLLIGSSGVSPGGSGCCPPSNGHRRSVFGVGKSYLPAVPSAGVGGGASVGPVVGGNGGGPDFLFHPIAEDEPYHDISYRHPRETSGQLQSTFPPPPLVGQVPGRTSDAFSAWQPDAADPCHPQPVQPVSGETFGDFLQDGGSGLDGLPRQMERGCKLTAGGSPPPPL